MRSLEKLDRATRQKVEEVQRRLGTDAKFRQRLVATLRTVGLPDDAIAGITIVDPGEVTGYKWRVEIGDCCVPVPDSDMIYCFFCDDV